MACRLHNRHTHPLRIDLRGGETLTLKPGESSGALLEELLYDNQHLPQWEASGWVVRLPARFAETRPQARAGAEAPAEESAEGLAGEPEDEAEAGPEEDRDAESPKRPRRRNRR